MTWPATQTVTENTYRTHITHECSQPCLLLLWDWRRQEVTSAGTHITSPGFTGTCTFMGPLSISMVPLSVWYPHPDPGPLTHLTGPPLLTGCSSLMHQTCSSHALVAQAPHSCSFSLGISTDFLPTLCPCLDLLLTTWSNWKFAGECTCTPHQHLVWGRYRHSPPAPSSTRHKTCDPRSYSSCQC